MRNFWLAVGAALLLSGCATPPTDSAATSEEAVANPGATTITTTVRTQVGVRSTNR